VRHVDVVIPALDEAASIGDVVGAVRSPLVRVVVVVDNGSVDATATVAARAGAIVIHEARRGYGAACLAGLRALPPDGDVAAFIDADGSDDPARLPALVGPILDDEADLVVGSRVLGPCEAGALTPPQRIGNAIAARWLRVRFGLPATDLGPFRAIRRDRLAALGMTSLAYGWTVEMQIKAARAGLRYREIAVPYRRRRLGASKISGTARGTIGAAVTILGLLARYDRLGIRPTDEGRPRASIGADSEP